MAPECQFVFLYEQLRGILNRESRYGSALGGFASIF